MARPTIYDTPMTAAERMRRLRARKREATAPDTTEGHLARATRKTQAKFVGCSERHWYNVQAYGRYRAFDWDGDILDGKYGRCGMAFIAEVCRLGSPEAQREVHDMIKEHGPAFARRIWRIAKRAG